MSANGSSQREVDARNEAIEILNEHNMMKDLDSLMAKAKHYEQQGRQKLALDQLNQAIAMHSWFTPALVEKAKLFIASGEFDQASEMCQRISNQSNEQNSFDAIMTTALIDVVHQGKNVLENFRRLVMSISRGENTNAKIHYQISRLFARLSGRNKNLLELTIKMVNNACELDPKNSVYTAEKGYQHRLMGNHGMALDTYRDASRIDESNVEASYGMIYCQLMQGQVEDATQQLEFLSVIQNDDNTQSAELTFLKALIAIRKDRDVSAHLKLLDIAVEQHEHSFRSGGGLVDALDDYYKFNPDFLMEVAKEYLQHLNTMGGGMADGELPEPAVVGLSLLQKVTDRVPALLGAHLVMAKARFEMKQYDQTLTTLNHCLSINAAHSETHLVMSQLYLARNDYNNANASLEQALSYDFKIRNSPIYQLVKSECLANQGALDEARQQLEDAMQLPGVRDGLDSSISVGDRVSIFVQLANIYSKLNMLSEADNILAEGKSTFAGTADQIKILVAMSDIAIRNNDFTKAINLLSTVPPDSMLHIHACIAKADIYLKHRHDKQAFAQCYLDLVASDKSSSNYTLLGEAYMRIQAPESAIEAFENALRLTDNDTRLAEKIGRALVSTHNYQKAQDYYEDALRNMPENIIIRFDLARLYNKLKLYDLAERVLVKALSKADEDGEGEGMGMGMRADFKTLVGDVETLLLLVETHKGSNDMREVKSTLKRARNIQNMVLEKSRTGSVSNENKTAQKKLAADICYALGEIETDDDRAIDFFGEALQNYAVHEKSMLALARMHLNRHNLDACQDQCNTLFRVGAGLEEATMMMGDLKFMRSDFEGATVQYLNLLETNPNNYVAMEKVVSLLRRAGALEEAVAIFERAEKNDPRSSSHAGLFFSKGCYYRYTNNITDAVKNFNLARRDGEWGTRALECMIEVYLNPDSGNMWEDMDNGEGNSEAVRVAEKLLRELDVLGVEKTKRHKVLANYHLLATRTKSNIDLAMQNFIEMLETDKDYLPALLGMSTAFMMEKSSNKARNTLKRIAKMTYKIEDANEFERSYLMLADIYVGRGKFDLAQDLCKKCLGYNKSCSKAWELMGVIMEKEQSYKDAADCYEKSWIFEHEASATIGYKLAFNYLKAKRYVEAIDICNAVLTLYPDYPKIRKEILEKAMSSLRP